MGDRLQVAFATVTVAGTGKSVSMSRRVSTQSTRELATLKQQTIVLLLFSPLLLGEVFMRLLSAAVLFVLCGTAAVQSQPPPPPPAPFPKVWIATPVGGAELPCGGFYADGTYADLGPNDTLVLSCYAADGTSLCATEADWGGGYWCATAPGFNSIYTGKGYVECAIVRNGVPSWADTRGVTFK